MDYIIYFFIYSVLGFLLETAYTRIKDGKGSTRRSMLYSPMCIVYGIGGAALAMCGLSKSAPAAFAFSAGFFVCSAAEYAAAMMYECVCGVRLWDYSQNRANLGGRVCALYSLYWGIVSVIFFKIIHPYVTLFLDSVNEGAKAAFCIIASIYFIRDIKITSREMKKLSNGEKSLCDGVMGYILPAPERKIF